MFKELIKLREIYKNKKNELTNKSNMLSNMRLIIFIILLILSISIKFNFKDSLPITIINIILLVIFFMIVIIHNRIAHKEEQYQKRIDIINSYESKRNGKYENFNQDELDITNDLSIDLDLTKEDSLFELLNISKSINSKKLLIKKLIEPSLKEKDILLNQEAITELKDNPLFIIDYQYLLNDIKKIEEKDYTKNLDILKEEAHVSKKEVIFGIITAIITDIILLLGIFNIINIRFFIAAIIIQLIISYIYQFKYNHELSNIAISGRLFTDYKNIYELINKNNFKSKKLTKLQKDINDGTNIINKLTKICNLDGYRYNFLTNTLFNAIFSLNIVVLYKYNKLINENKNTFISNTESITELENLISLTTIALIKDNVTLPKINKETKLSFTNIAHPLLEEKTCITNNFETKDDINIITGSNMSGKTSFMRTIAINLILMYNGTYVNATTFSSSLNKIFTSIRVTDDIKKGISTFYGELLRIEKILKHSAKKDEPIIVFIDEIFKGTNYNDRILGAKEIIKKLSKLNCIVLITTHDFELCEIENKKINNYHFEEQYIENKITFDYKIKNGRCKTTNAKYLMSLIGIIDK